MVSLEGVRARARHLGHPVIESRPKPTPPVAAVSPPIVEEEQATPPPGTMLVPIEAWDKMLLQLGNLHEAGQQLAEARERVAVPKPKPPSCASVSPRLEPFHPRRRPLRPSRMRAQTLPSPTRVSRPRCPDSAPICGGWRSRAATRNRHFSRSLFVVVLEIGPCRDIDAVVLRGSKRPPLGARESSAIRPPAASAAADPRPQPDRPVPLTSM